MGIEDWQRKVFGWQSQPRGEFMRMQLCQSLVDNGERNAGKKVSNFSSSLAIEPLLYLRDLFAADGVGAVRIESERRFQNFL